MQPIGWDDTGKVIRFKQNKIVDWLLETSKFNLNDIIVMVYNGTFTREDYDQLMQLIGYSTSGYAELHFSPEETIDKAWEIADALSKERKLNGG